MKIMTAVVPDMYLDREVDSMDLPEWLPPRGHDGMWGLQEIAQALGVTYSAASKWRNNYYNDVAAGRPLRPASLPPEDDTDDRFGHHYGYPRWHPDTIVRWAQQTGRMDDEKRATKLKHRSGGIPGHRAPEQDERGRFKRGDSST